nr:MAG TPA: CHC2 zinc finger protein [Caudoviricetes sp.]
MSRVIFYKTATCPYCGKLATFAMDEKRKKVCRCMVLEPGNEVKVIIVKVFREGGKELICRSHRA